jgi:hypothetical protein
MVTKVEGLEITGRLVSANRSAVGTEATLVDVGGLSAIGERSEHPTGQPQLRSLTPKRSLSRIPRRSSVTRATSRSRWRRLLYGQRLRRHLAYDRGTSTASNHVNGVVSSVVTRLDKTTGKVCLCDGKFRISPAPNPSQRSDNGRRPPASSLACQNSPVGTDLGSYWLPSGECRLLPLNRETKARRTGGCDNVVGG